MLRAITFILFLFIFLVYSLGVASSVFGGDSGDIILASWFGGVAHPPGYPLNTMIGWVFTHLPYPAPVAFKANLMAAFFMAVTICILFLIIEKLTRKIFVALACSLTLAFNPLFLLYAHVIEVFQLNLVLVGLSIYFLLRWRERKKDLLLILSSLFLGLSVFHHQTSVLIFPAYIYLVLKTDKKIFKNRKLLLKILGSFALGFLPFIFIPFAALRQTPINWNDPITLERFIRLITRADYGTFVASNNLVGDSFASRLLQLRAFFQFVKSDFSVLGVILLLVGFVFSFFKEKRVFYFTLLAVIFTGPFFLFYASFPIVNDFYLGLWERFVLLPYFFLAIFMGFGFFGFYRLLENIVSFVFRGKILKREAQELLIGCALLLIPLYILFVNYAKVDLRDFKIGDWLGHDTIASVEPNSILLIYADTPTFNSQYVLYSQNNPHKIKFILGGQLHHLEYRRQIMRSYPELKFEEDFIKGSESDSSKYILSLIASNKDSFSIYSSDYLPPLEKYRWMNTGLLKKLVKTTDYSADKLVSLNDLIYGKYLYNDFSQSLGYGHFMSLHIQAIYYRSLISLIDEMIVEGADEAATRYLQKAIMLTPQASEAYIRLGNVAFKKGQCVDARDNFEKAFSIDGKNWQLAEVLASVYKDCFKNDTEAQRYFDDVAKLKRSFEKPL